MAGVEASEENGEGQVQASENLKLIDLHTKTTAYLLLSSPRPAISNSLGEEVTAGRRVPDTGEAGVSIGWSISAIAEGDARSNEWGISILQKQWGRIEIQGRVAFFETPEFRDPSIAYLVEDRSDACPLSEVVDRYPEYTHEQLDGMASRGIKGVVKTRTGVVRHYKDGDSILVHQRRVGTTADRWSKIPL
jgi:hypothetical protein